MNTALALPNRPPAPPARRRARPSLAAARVVDEALLAVYEAEKALERARDACHGKRAN
jgi:hypothetical protein